ncbi:MAG: cytochrome c biogenesis protein ResB [Bacteroidales bacterium]|nr:cytochrome c biogenesis protein ResB [Bacteroidales bacterium]
MYRKPSLFLFHVAFILILFGAGVTRYFGFDGMMSIRENSSTNLVNSSENHITVTVDDGIDFQTKVNPVLFAGLGKNMYNQSFTVEMVNLMLN